MMKERWPALYAWLEPASDVGAQPLSMKTGIVRDLCMRRTDSGVEVSLAKTIDLRFADIGLSLFPGSRIARVIATAPSLIEALDATEKHVATLDEAVLEGLGERDV